MTLGDLGHQWSIDGDELLVEGTDHWTASHVSGQVPDQLHEKCHDPDT